jgi:hypothetical protein
MDSMTSWPSRIQLSCSIPLSALKYLAKTYCRYRGMLCFRRVSWSRFYKTVSAEIYG